MGLLLHNLLWMGLGLFVCVHACWNCFPKHRVLRCSMLKCVSELTFLVRPSTAHEEYCILSTHSSVDMHLGRYLLLGCCEHQHMCSCSSLVFFLVSILGSGIARSYVNYKSNLLTEHCPVFYRSCFILHFIHNPQGLRCYTNSCHFFLLIMATAVVMMLFQCSFNFKVFFTLCKRSQRAS